MKDLNRLLYPGENSSQSENTKWPSDFLGTNPVAVERKRKVGKIIDVTKQKYAMKTNNFQTFPINWI